MTASSNFVSNLATNAVKLQMVTASIDDKSASIFRTIHIGWATLPRHETYRRETNEKKMCQRMARGPLLECSQKSQNLRLPWKSKGVRAQCSMIVTRESKGTWYMPLSS